jgi:hypothetical protein
MATEFDSNESMASEARLKVSAYDKVASMLIALLIVVGFLVLLLLGIWLTGRLLLAKTPIPVDWRRNGSDIDHVPGFAHDMEEPGVEEIEELKDPQIESTLNDVEHLVRSQTSVLAAIESAAFSSRGNGGGNGKGIGPTRKTVIDDVIPHYERWEIRFSTSGIETYARQLDFFKIELGAAGGGSANVDYAFNLVKSKPDRRLGEPEDEDRLYMSWRKDGGPIAAFDRQLMSRAGIDTQRRLVLQFYPKEIEELLWSLEAQEARKAGHTDPKEFLKTIFGVRSAGNGYEFYVVDQYFRPAPMP